MSILIGIIIFGFCGVIREYIRRWRTRKDPLNNRKKGDMP